MSRAICEACRIKVMWSGRRGARLAEWACPRCGGPLRAYKRARVCPNPACGRALDRAERLCTFCGTCMGCGGRAIRPRPGEPLFLEERGTEWVHPCPLSADVVTAPLFISPAKPRATP